VLGLFLSGEMDFNARNSVTYSGILTCQIPGNYSLAMEATVQRPAKNHNYCSGISCGVEDRLYLGLSLTFNDN